MKAHPMIDGTPLLLGDRVVANRGSEYYEVTGEVVEITVRCWGRHEMEPVKGYVDGEWKDVGEQEMEQVWVFLVPDGDERQSNQIFTVEKLERLP